MDLKFCVVCRIETRKYKCPKCLEPYCSLQCYKNHKEIDCTIKKQESTDNDTESNIGKESKKIPVPFKTEDTVDPERLEMLRHSEQLKNLLYNPHLRNLLKEIDEAPNAWKAMRAAMQEPLFIEFADECLKIVEPSEELCGN